MRQGRLIVRRIELMKEMVPHTYHLAWFGANTVVAGFDAYAKGRALTPAETKLGNALKALRDGLLQMAATTFHDDGVPRALVELIRVLQEEAEKASIDAGLTLDAMFTAAGYPTAS